MRAGKYESDVTGVAAAIGAALSGKIEQIIDANPYRRMKPPPKQTPEQAKTESRRAFAMMRRCLKDHTAKMTRGKRNGTKR
jgi:hypothetical protein